MHLAFQEDSSQGNSPWITPTSQQRLFSSEYRKLLVSWKRLINMKIWSEFGQVQFVFPAGIFTFLWLLLLFWRFWSHDYMSCEYQEELLKVPNWIFMFNQKFSLVLALFMSWKAMQMGPKRGICLLCHLLYGVIYMGIQHSNSAHTVYFLLFIKEISFSYMYLIASSC